MSSLTAPWDRQLVAEENVKVIVEHLLSSGIKLTKEQVNIALQELVDTELIDKFPKVDKKYADPIYNNQVFCLHSFVPSKGATPDSHGVFGFMKCRGTFFTEKEASQRAEFLIRNGDSYHPMHTSYCGRPFPVALDTARYVKETDTIDIKKKETQVISEDIKHKRMEEKNEIKQIKQREEKLLHDSKLAEQDEYEEEPIDKYIQLKVKKANLVFNYLEARKKIEYMQDRICVVYKEIEEMEESSDVYKKEYKERYMNARRESHIPDDANEDNWMKYLDDEAELDFNIKKD